ncbi:alpha-amylase family glycosyl hydrolase [Bizionia sp. KMM 8389]
MKKIILILLIVCSSLSAMAQLSWQGGVTPGENDSATLLFDKTGTGLASYNGPIYAHTGVTINDSNAWQNVIADWGDNSNQPELTLVSGNIYSLTLSPSIKAFYNYTGTGTITGINIVLRNAAGNQQTTDLTIPVGSFQVTLNTPEENSTTILDSGSNLNISASNTNGNASYTLLANGNNINSNASTNSYTYNHLNITENTVYSLEVSQGSDLVTKTFSVIVNPVTITEAMPENLLDGINYNTTDDTKATLVLDAPNKDYVYIAGSFNNWQPTASYAMKQDPITNKFWLELENLVSGTDYTYQYWAVDETPISNSPQLVKTADPYSTLVLSPFDDSGISSTTYPNLPAFPEGQEREVTVLKTGQTAYNWQVSDFEKPKKEDLVIYEVLIRDFDGDRNFQDLIDKIDYFKNLNVNAIQLMPVMEYEGNESWGYNTSFHMALDKYYGTEEKLKEFIDLCHQNGIAVILDVALNHAFGRNPMVRLWMNDPDGDGWGEPSSENPYFNQTPRHSYNVGSDFNHASNRTKTYVKRVVKHWVETFNIDGFRWDLTKGFTQNCTESDESCTNAYQQDRVDILKDYADYSWSLDETHYVIFEHLGQDTEEQEWANYRIDENKGIMLWGKMTDPYNQLTMGYASNSNIDRMGHEARGFTAPRLVGYSESHDEERLMYKNLQYGNGNAEYDITDLNTAISRMSALGAVSLTIPGPKMIWHFGELGMENSIFTCNNGTVNEPGGTDGDCKLDTKPQPQWANNWLSDVNRSQVYNDWARINSLKINQPVFEGDYSITSGTLTPAIHIWDDELPSNQLKNVVILANFDVTEQSVTPDFPYTGTWFDLMDETGNTFINVTSITAPITIPAGEFRMYGNATTLSTNEFNQQETFRIFPNPAKDSFKINASISQIEIYDLTGKRIKSFKGRFSSSDSFDISDLNEGLYIIKVTDNSGNNETTKLIKL